MEKQTIKKVTTLSFLGAALVTYIAISILFKSLAAAFGPVQRLYSMDVVSHGLPLISAVLVFAVLQFNGRILLWAEDVITEISKVVWPSRKDTTAMTIVVCVFVGIASIVLVLIDFLSQNLISLVVQ